MGKPTVPEVLPLVRALYASPGGRVGCHLHIVLDDGNVQDKHVQFCIDRAAEDQCGRCLVLAGMLMLMSKTQRAVLAAMDHSPWRVW